MEAIHENAFTAEPISSYQQDGFVVIPGFLDAEGLMQWQRVTDEAVAQRLATASSPGDDYYKQVFTPCLKLAEIHEGMRGLMHDPRLGEAAATLAGVDGIRIWHDQALFKPPYGNPTVWHLDNSFWSFSSRNSISIWGALDADTRRCAERRRGQSARLAQVLEQVIKSSNRR